MFEKYAAKYNPTVIFQLPLSGSLVFFKWAGYWREEK